MAAVVNDYYSGQPCGKSGHTVHIAVDGEARCCLERKCAKGTVGEMCNETDAASSQCVSCPENQFMSSKSKSSDMLRCFSRRHCPSKRGLTVRVNGTLVSNNVCKCHLEHGFWDPKKLQNPKSCWFEECDVGHELTENGCKACKPGMFKKNKGIEMCNHWTDCGAIGLSYGPNGNTSYNPGCVNDTIRLSTGASKHADNNNSYEMPLIVGGAVGGIFLTVFAIFAILFWRLQQQHGQVTDQPVGDPSTGVEGMSTQPYVAMNGVNGVQTHKDSYDTMLSPKEHHEYEDLDGQTDKDREDEASSEIVEEDAQLYDDNSKTSPTPQNNTPLSATVTTGKDRSTVINISAAVMHLQYGDHNGMDITQSSE